MNDLSLNKKELEEKGFTTIERIFTVQEIDAMLQIITEVDSTKSNFRKTDDLFAIRQVLKEIPQLCSVIFTKRLLATIRHMIGDSYFVVKSIFFDKPGASNWFVSYHQDLTISVDKKIPIEGFGPWSVKQDQFAVQPPLYILESNITIRIHLDHTDENNGALRVIPKSHRKGIYRPETINWNKEKEEVCPVGKGGVMFMRPLLLHASSKTTNHLQRRVLHIELSKQELPEPLQWSERLMLF
ncbi:MAG TPA: phytanoyl-CoA dioxygenase family protein [Flavisolibacter sp.]|jgi:ectoine hydroxylase-related dioxygenase (phytanoyl-CoA dioxygenase family)|nr:phytanoyl-CoA dioxygenase family protein [Flavisolibacter sp.]